MASVFAEPPARPPRNPGRAAYANTRANTPDRAGSRIDVLLAHPDPVGLAAIRYLLDGDERVRIVGVSGDGEETVALAGQLRPAVAVVDDRLATPGCAERIARWTRLIVLTDATDPAALTAMLLGPASGCLSYQQLEPGDMLGAVRTVAAGLTWLCPLAVSAVTAAMRASAEPATSPRPAGSRWDHLLTKREREVLELLCQGMSNAAIASTLTLAEKTVKNHLSRTFAKLGVRTRAEAVQRMGFKPPG